MTNKDEVDCLECGGTGEVPCSECDNEKLCPLCNGTGKETD